MKKKVYWIIFVVLGLSSLSCGLFNSFTEWSSRGNAPDPQQDIESIEQELELETVSWTCQAEDISEILGKKTEDFPLDLINLILDVKTTGDRLNYTFSFLDKGTFLIERDDDYRPPPGATVVPEGLYQVEYQYQGAGTASWDSYNSEQIFVGKNRVDCEQTIFFPTPDVQNLPFEYPAVGLAYKSGDSLKMDLCLGVNPAELNYVIENGLPELRYYCVWPGYVFVCTASQ